MKLGLPFSKYRFSAPQQSFAVQSPFSALISNQDAPRAFLLDAQLYEPVSEQLVDIGFSAGLKRPVLNARVFPARLAGALNVETTLFADEIGRGGAASVGVIKVLIGDTEHDAILDYEWDGRSVRVLMGAEGFDWSQFQPVFVGTAQDIQWNDRELSIVLRDKSELLNIDIQSTQYAGSGGLEGGADLIGVPKPLSYGPLQNIQPVLVDRTNLIYQFHDGSAQTVSAVYDGAGTLTSAGDVADITATTVTAGQYKTQLSGGYIRLGAEPAKILTADVQGDNSGGYVSSAADIVRRVIETRSGMTSADINLQSISDTNTANSAAVGWYGNSGTVADAISQVIESIGGSWVFDRNGLLNTGVFRFNTPSGVIAAKDVVRIERVRTPLPTWRRQIGYARSWTVQGQADVVGSAAASRKDFVSRAWRYAVAETSAIKTRRALARSVTLDTLA